MLLRYFSSHNKGGWEKLFPRLSISTSPSSKPTGLFTSQGHCEFFNWSDFVLIEGTFMALQRDRSGWSWKLIPSFLADSRLSRSQLTWPKAVPLWPGPFLHRDLPLSHSPLVRYKCPANPVESKALQGRAPLYWNLGYSALSLPLTSLSGRVRRIWENLHSTTSLLLKFSQVNPILDFLQVRFLTQHFAFLT